MAHKLINEHKSKLSKTEQLRVHFLNNKYTQNMVNKLLLHYLIHASFLNTGAEYMHVQPI